MSYGIENNEFRWLFAPLYVSQPLQQQSKLAEVLLIEDTNDLEVIIPLGLKLIAGVKAIVVHPSQNWLDMVRTQMPAVILIDIVEGGEDILRSLKNDPKAQHIPVVYTVDRDWPQDRRPITQLGATTVISRPFDIVFLVKSITQLMGSQIQYNTDSIAGHLTNVLFSS